MTVQLTTPHWQVIKRRNFTKLEPLCDFLELTQQQRSELAVYPSFPLNLPLRLAEKIPKKTLQDPLARQFLPFKQESLGPFISLDPVEDKHFQVTPNLLQKYQERVLLITTGACAMHCRYCFRQNYEYMSCDFEKEIATIAQDSSLKEVILSGGDPLSLSDERLFNLLHRLSSIPHIERLRIHTRFPIGIPERLDENFLKNCVFRQPLWVVLHINHPKEVDADVLAALNRWRQHGALLLNQAVLLKDVNDDFATLYNLCSLLINHGIRPYYLHQLDRVQGSHNFEVSVAQGQKLIQQLREHLPGYAVPLFVQEIPSKSSKTPL